MLIPRNWEEWYILPSCSSARWIVQASVDELIHEVMEGSEPYSDRIVYYADEGAEVLNRKNGCALVKLIGSGRVGYVDTSVVTLTQKERVAIAAKEKTDRESAEKLRQERIATCSTLYRDTSNKKVSEITVNQSQVIQACTSLGLYRHNK